MLSILLVPVQEAEVIPVPQIKPVLSASVQVPVPETKPDVTSETVEYTQVFRMLTINVASLFTPAEKTYTNGFTPLSAKDAKLYKLVFAKQMAGDMKEAWTLSKTISNDTLMGHVLYQRYMHPTYKSNYSELASWMARYSDYPNANDIYKLAVSKRGSDKGALTAPTTNRLLSQVKEPTMQYGVRYQPTLKRTASEQKSVDALKRNIKAMVRSGKMVEALKVFTNAPERSYIDKVEHDQIQIMVAKGLFYHNRLDSALKLAQQSADRSGKYVPQGNWITGLILWQKGDYVGAARYFDSVGRSSYASGWLSAAGSYWAARSYGMAGQAGKRKASLKLAATHTRTFYGLLAAQALGQSLDFDWSVPKYNVSHEDKILSYEAGKRAFSLVAAERYDLAEAELMRLPFKQDKDLYRAVLSYASHVGLPGIALRLGNMVQASKDKYYDSAMYPISPWSPEDGYKLDPALVHAVIRQESRFNLNAKSYSGALGLMQVMPKTAEYVAKMKHYPTDMNTQTLRMPAANMKVGQDYLDYLLNGQYVKGNVVDLLVAYNAGPGNLLKWRGRMKGNTDPLLFIETLPVQETRDYVEHVLSNYWIYRDRAGLDLPSLAALSQGKAPKYAHVMQAQYPYQLASN